MPRSISQNFCCHRCCPHGEPQPHPTSAGDPLILSGRSGQSPTGLLLLPLGPDVHTTLCVPSKIWVSVETLNLWVELRLRLWVGSHRFCVLWIFDALWFWKSYWRQSTAGEGKAVSRGGEAKDLQFRLEVLMYIQDKTASWECSSDTFNMNAVMLMPNILYLVPPLRDPILSSWGSCNSCTGECRVGFVQSEPRVTRCVS